MTTVSFHTLGCKMNRAETEQLKGTALASGLDTVEFGSHCDICVINTCTVTALADKKSRQAIRKAIRLSKGNVYVTGCLADLDAEAIKKIDDRLEIIVRAGFKPALTDAAGTGLVSSQPPRLRSNLIIQNGCNNFCSYCIVPYARGRETERHYEDIISEAKKMVRSGVKEIILTGINTGAFKELPGLLDELSQIKDLLRIRLSSIEPLNITEKLIKTISKNKKICRHLHIPLQSGDDTVLKNMNRKYSAEEYSEIIKSLKKEMPGIAISTDIIVGFPGETAKQFQNTVDLVRKTGFTRLHVFRFSKRKGTPAAEMKDQIDPKTIAKRAKIMHKLRGELMLGYHKSLIGTEQDILIEQRDKRTDLLEGLTDTYVRTFAKGPDEMTGKLLSIKVKNVQIEHVFGSIDKQTSQTD